MKPNVHEKTVISKTGFTTANRAYRHIANLYNEYVEEYNEGLGENRRVRKNAREVTKRAVKKAVKEEIKTKKFQKCFLPVVTSTALFFKDAIFLAHTYSTLSQK